MQEVFTVLLWICSILLIISGIDDVMVDLLYWFNRWKYNRSLPKVDEVLAAGENNIALVICAWREYKVIGRTLTYALSKMRYSNFTIFVGIYPNDTKTLEVVKRIAQKNNKVVICVNSHDGPTTKADNLNNVYESIKRFEKDNGKNFDIISIHDSEDFIHPLTLKIDNYLIMHQGVDAVQIPVVPIKDDRGKFIHRTYCDAFAEVHSKDLVVRQALKVFIPFAGTGMSFRREIFMNLDAHYPQVFNEANLTEDYELGLRLFKMGYKTAYINLLIDKNNPNSRVATGEYFPNTFWAAVKQRSRWTAGICFQNWKMHKWGGNLKTKYFLMRDRKTIFSNFMVLLSNLVFALFLLYLLGFGLGIRVFESAVEQNTALWFFLWACFFFMVWRLAHRFIFTYSWYGLKYAFFSLIRLNFDNLINFFATFRAMKVFMNMKNKVVWESTDHY
ncbi:MAG TPA: glycosyltransferase [Ignavibacteria bacterium]|nr:phage adsorption protein NrfB [Ignavibacteria bacterium]HRJ04871.1 glycosyltransferase [Ignavibacteria bacterium]